MTYVIGISGKIGSGKDYTAAKLVEELNARGRTTAHSSFAKPLKYELGEIIDLLKANRDLSQNELEALVSEKFNMSEVGAGWLVSRLCPELDIPDLNGWSRTLGVRGSLQVLGTDIRRAQNPDYWTEKFFAEANSLNADFVFATDGRFPNEMDGVNTRNGVTLRMDISEETLKQRRDNRDGITYTPEQLNHISETALDDYEDFDVYVGEVLDVPALADFIEKKAGFTKSVG
jgi:hypothetical protein